MNNWMLKQFGQKLNAHAIFGFMQYYLVRCHSTRLNLRNAGPRKKIETTSIRSFYFKKQFGIQISSVFFRENGVYIKLGSRSSILHENSPIFFWCLLRYISSPMQLSQGFWASCCFLVHPNVYSFNITTVQIQTLN